MKKVITLFKNSEHRNTALMLRKEDVSLRKLSSFTVSEDQVSIESGYFIFTLMPSLQCHFNCPHCYLSLEQRRDATILAVEDLKIIARKVDAYYQSRQMNASIQFYWYGGEPTTMGIEYFTAAIEGLNAIFSKEKGYHTKHTVLTSLINLSSEWFDFFNKYCEGSFQTSYDGGMRGSQYVKSWERSVREAMERGLEVSTISVVNRSLLLDGAKNTLDYLASLQIRETSWLPFMWNEQNDGDPYDTFAPSMNDYSDFLKEVTEEYIQKDGSGLFVPEIGQMHFILGQKNSSLLANRSAQTLFLLPNGDMVLPDYKNKYQEFMQFFGNGLTQSFEEILQSPQRKDYLRKQLLLNKNKECMDCEHSNQCLMEFWKENRVGDDCFGAKSYVEWILTHQQMKKYEGVPILY